MLNRVTVEVKLCALRQETLTPLATTILEDAAASLGRHAGTETVLTFAGALGGLVSHLHGRLQKGRSFSESERRPSFRSASGGEDRQGKDTLLDPRARSLASDSGLSITEDDNFMISRCLSPFPHLRATMGTS